jgi:hypothetical protein
MRLFACAGVVSTGLLMGGGIAAADSGDAAGAAPDAATVTSKSDDNDSGSGATGASNPEPPSTTFGNGREDVDVKTTEDDLKNNGASSATKKFKGGFWTIPILRIPRRDELPPSGLPSLGLFITTVVIPTPIFGEPYAEMEAQPPTPAPGPTFKTQEEAPPVADSGGGGVDPLSDGVAAEPPVLQAPMVIAPLPIPVSAPTPPVAPLGTAAGASPPPAVAVEVASAGVSVPAVRGSLPPPTVEPVNPVNTATISTSAQATRLGPPRYVRKPTAGELALVALPGVAGLLMLTMSGGVIGYRQANSTRVLLTENAARFLR